MVKKRRKKPKNLLLFILTLVIFSSLFYNLKNKKELGSNNENIKADSSKELNESTENEKQDTISDDTDLNDTNNNPNSEDTKIKDCKKTNSKYSDLSKDTINTFDLSSKTSKLIITDISEQKTYVYSGKKNNWTLQKEFICSTGLESEPTPTGTFTVENKAPWFFSEKYGQGGKYWVGFKGNYLFHSVPFDRSQKNILDPTLGEPASHGCIRLSVEDSKWLFNNTPIGSKVLIY